LVHCSFVEMGRNEGVVVVVRRRRRKLNGSKGYHA
jgi:hypothetical protein